MANKPRWYQWLRLTRLGVYFYCRRFTLSITRGFRWRWLPWCERLYPGWIAGWGWLGVGADVWDWDDDWGAKTSELRRVLLEMLAEQRMEEWADEQEGKSDGR